MLPSSPGNFLRGMNRDFPVTRVAHTTPPKSLAEFEIHPARFASSPPRSRRTSNVADWANFVPPADNGDSPRRPC